MRNKNKFITFLLALVFSFSVFASAFAETNPPPPPPSSTRSEKSQGSDAVRQARVLESRREAVRKLMNNQINRITRALTRLTGVLERIETRRDKMSAKGLDVSKIDTLIDTATAKKTEAEALLEKMKDDLADVSTSETPKAAAMDFIKQTKELKKKLIEFHKSMLNIVQEMKKLEKTLKNTSTTGNSGSGEEENE